MRSAQRTVKEYDESIAVLGAPDLTVERVKAYAGMSRAMYGL